MTDMKKASRVFLFGILLILGACGPKNGKSTAEDDAIQAQLDSMTLREKVGQLFCIRPESYNVALKWETYDQLASYQLTAVSEQMKKVNREYPVGGIILFAYNIEDEAQLSTFRDSLKAFKGAPLIYIDEEGGRVARIGNNPNFAVEKFESMGAIGKTGDPKNAYHCGNTIGTYLKRYGFDVDLAPVADVNTNPKNPVIGTRAFSDDPELAAKMVVSCVKGLKDAGVASCLKHFPGHGDTSTDTHFGYAQTLKTWEEMKGCEMVTFKAGIDAGVPMIMTAHIAAPGVTGSGVPSTLSPVILTEKLRKELGFQGIIITDSMAMGAITREYDSATAAVLSLQAGADIILDPKVFTEAFDGVMKAVQQDSTLTEARIDESVRRILKLKASLQ